MKTQKEFLHARVLFLSYKEEKNMAKNYKNFLAEAEMASEREKWILPDELEETRRQSWPTIGEECYHSTPVTPLEWGFASFYGCERNPYGDGREDWSSDYDPDSE